MFPSILRLGSAVQVDDDLKTSLTCPFNGFVDIWSGALDIRTGKVSIGPVPDGNPNGVEASSLDALEVGKSDERVPMLR